MFPRLFPCCQQRDPRSQRRGPNQRQQREKPTSPALAGLFQCTQGDSNSHPAYAGQGPQPDRAGDECVRTALLSPVRPAGETIWTDLAARSLSRSCHGGSERERSLRGRPRPNRTAIVPARLSGQARRAESRSQSPRRTGVGSPWNRQARSREARASRWASWLWSRRSRVRVPSLTLTHGCKPAHRCVIWGQGRAEHRPCPRACAAWSLPRQGERRSSLTLWASALRGRLRSRRAPLARRERSRC